MKKTLKKIIKNILPFGVVKYFFKFFRCSDLPDFTINYNVYQNMSIQLRKIIPKLPSGIDLVVGIPRSGMIPAYMLALFLNKRCCTLTEFVRGIEAGNGVRPLTEHADGKYILIVDDSIASGSALLSVKKELDKVTVYGKEFLFLSVFAQEASSNLVDFYCEIVNQPRIFQWNYMYHSIIEKSCVDLDGVLCVDPAEEENDDGENYCKFISSAKKLYIPPYEIYAIVTSRLEKYRYQTEQWLKKNNIEYKKLFMLDLKNKEERIKLHAHAKFKAEVYASLPEAVLFIESNNTQAQEIAKISKKACICIETDSLYEGN